MKKFACTLAAVAAFSALLPSCRKEMPVETLNTPGEETSIPAGRHEMVFSTTLTKTSYDEGRLSWAEGDSIRILWSEVVGKCVSDPEKDSIAVYSDTVMVNAADGSFKAVVGDARDYYYAVYPWWTATSLLVCEGQTDTLSITVRNTSADGSWSSAHYATAVTDASTACFNFKNVSNVLKFTISTPDVTKVKIATNDGTATAGRFRFSFSGEDVPTDYSMTTTYTSSTITVNGPGTYYAPVIMDAQWLGGFTVEESVGDSLVSFTISEKELCMSRDEVYNLGTIEDHKATPRDWYFTPGGNGTKSGEDWDNAADNAKLIDILGHGLWYNFVNGHNIYLAEGSFDLYDAAADNGNLAMNYKSYASYGVYGGYSSSSTGTDLSQRGGTTTLTNVLNPAPAKARILYLNGVRANIIFDRIDWKPLSGTGYRGCCVYANASCHGSLAFNDCTLDGSSTAAYGPFAQFASMDVTLDRCSFTNNVSTATDKQSGGVVVCSNNTTTTFNDCLFKDNTSSGNGVGISVNAGAVVRINRCVFDNNTCNRGSVSLKTAGNGRGGAVQMWYDNASFNSVVDNPAPKLYIDSCEFRNNKSTHLAGADICVYSCVTGGHPELYINRSYFHDAQISGTDTNYGTYYNAKSINIDGQNADSQTIVGIYNTTFGPNTSPNYPKNCAGIYWCNADFNFVNSTILDSGVACFRNDMRSYVKEQPTTTCHLLNSIASHTGGGNSINANRDILPANLSSGYNIMGATKNAYTMATWKYAEDSKRVRWVPGTTKPNPETDGYVVYSDMNFKLDEAGGVYEFSITEGKENDEDRPVQYTTAQAIADSVAKFCPTLDAWLKTIHTDPYVIDKNGNPRSPAKLQKGSWDPGL